MHSKAIKILILINNCDFFIMMIIFVSPYLGVAVSGYVEEKEQYE